MKSVVDLHTHSIVSGHAYSTLSEMIDAAQKKGLKLFGVTEHGPNMPGSCHSIYYRNLRVIPRQYGEMRLMMGSEMNIIDFDGNVDLPSSIIKDLDLRIAGLHGRAFTNGTVMENTDAIINTMKRPDIDIISHPVDGTAELDIKAIVQCSVETKTILELNNSSLNPARDLPFAKQNFTELLGYCKEMNVPVILGSDAHITYDIANHKYAYGLVQEVGFPDELILNGDDVKFLKYLEEMRESKQA